MAGRGETLSMFVVQGTFRTVRRGYDPEEVDAHLERAAAERRRAGRSG